MPPVAAAVIPAALGAAGSASGGKKGGNAAKDAANKQFQFQQQLFNTAQSAWQPAKDYWSALLGGDPNKVSQAVGPYADIIHQQGQAASRELAAMMPAGGEAAAAQAANAAGNYSQIARLSAGMQPQAAQALGQLSGLPMQLAAPNVGSGLKFDTHQQQMASDNKRTLGTRLGGVLQRGTSFKGSGGKSSSRTPSFNPSGAYAPGFSQLPTEGY